MNDTTWTAGLGEDQIRTLVQTAALAPSLHNSQPWRFRPGPGYIDLLGDDSRRLPAGDPSGRELRIACGAALCNLRLAILEVGLWPIVTLCPEPGRPDLIARVRYGGRRRADPEERGLIAAIPRRHTNRTRFTGEPITTAEQNALRLAATEEGGWLHLVLGQAQREKLGELARRAHETQVGDSRFRAELAEWTSQGPDRADGVPAGVGGPHPPPDDVWRRDFSDGTRDTAAAPVPHGAPAAVGPGGPQPLVAVLSTHTGGISEDVRAGVALQRVLLTATVHGLAVSFLSQLVEVAEVREEVRRLVRGVRPAQAVLRIGHGVPVPATPRRPPDELIVVDRTAATTSGAAAQ